MTNRFGAFIRSIFFKAFLISFLAHGVLFWVPFLDFDRAPASTRAGNHTLKLKTSSMKALGLKNNRRESKGLKKIPAGESSEELFRKTASARELLEDPEEGKIFFPYFQIIKTQISKASRLDRTDRQGAGGRIELDFILNSSGRIIASNPRPAGPAGSLPELSSRALRILEDAAPFPPFPDKIDAPSIFFSITLIFKPEEN